MSPGEELYTALILDRLEEVGIRSEPITCGEHMKVREDILVRGHTCPYEYTPWPTPLH